MPYINVKITDENVTRPQKDELIAGITELIEVIL
jgi:4-oxalocrotonate tautomerase